MITRRQAIGGARALTLLGPAAVRAAWREGYPFILGVVSGEPAPEGMVLWTRLAPQPLLPDGGMSPAAVPLSSEVAAATDFRDTRRGTVLAQPEWGHLVHIEVAGCAPGRPYFYRFRAGGEASPVGRPRTAPAHGARIDRLRCVFWRPGLQSE